MNGVGGVANSATIQSCSTSSRIGSDQPDHDSRGHPLPVRSRTATVRSIGDAQLLGRRCIDARMQVEIERAESLQPAENYQPA
jgi:hypothetical protein